MDLSLKVYSRMALTLAKMTAQIPGFLQKFEIFNFLSQHHFVEDFN
ncbi:hypothetical protein ACFE35_09535 [Phormidesmis priestleyi ANT.L61.2]